MRQRLPTLRLLIPATTIVVPLLAVLLAPMVILRFGCRTADIVSLLATYCFSAFGITLGYHRGLAHKSLSLRPGARYVFLALGAMAAQGPPSFWVAHHRAHHGDPDGPRDPHSPREKGFLHAHVGWMFGAVSRCDARAVRELRKDPVVRGVDDHYFFLILLGLVLPAVMTLPFSASWPAFLVSIYWGLVRIGLCHQATWLVNSACHLWGYRNFQTADSSRNNWIVAALTLGEGWHNNHHANPSRVRHGLKLWEVDPTFSLARLLEMAGLARIPGNSARSNSAIHTRIHRRGNSTCKFRFERFNLF